MHKKFLLSFLICLLLFVSNLTQAQTEFNPGKSRWSIKTSTEANAKQKKVVLKDLLALPFPEGIQQDDKHYQDKLIPANAFPDNLNLHEGEIITITGWLHLVALEKDKNNQDGDYHIQITNSENWEDSCFIVEIPFPEFVKDRQLREECSKARAFVRDSLLKGEEPSKGGSVMQKGVFVKITGQLFLDAAHKKAGARGKKQMKSYTSWEIHPVTEISFAKKPK